MTNLFTPIKKIIFVVFLIVLIVPVVIFVEYFFEDEPLSKIIRDIRNNWEVF